MGGSDLSRRLSRDFRPVLCQGSVVTMQQQKKVCGVTKAKEKSIGKELGEPGELRLCEWASAGGAGVQAAGASGCLSSGCSEDRWLRSKTFFSKTAPAVLLRWGPGGRLLGTAYMEFIEETK